MKKIIILIVVLLLTISKDIIAQNFGGCGTSDDTHDRYSSLLYNNTSDTWRKIRTPSYWIPNDSIPIKTILVNWVICRDNNGQNGWQDCTDFRNQVELIVYKNQRMVQQFSSQRIHSYM